MSDHPSPYPEAPSNPDFPELEEQVLQFWDTHQVFETSVEQRDKWHEYVFYDGPPFANGLPHHGHLLTGFVKDLFARYHTMKGERVERRFGWDCHGLPAEMEAEKELNISGRRAIIDYGIRNFNEYCRSSVMRYAGEWEWYVNRQARWVDFKNDYKTMDTPYMESVIWAFKQLYDKGLIYEGFKVMPYSWAAETVLSASEIRLDDATREKEDKAVTVAFRLKEKPEGAPEADEYYVLAWTTTPWTLPSNLALAVSAEMEYAAIMMNRSPLEGEPESVTRSASDPVESNRLTSQDANDTPHLTSPRKQGEAFPSRSKRMCYILGAAAVPDYLKEFPNAQMPVVWGDDQEAELELQNKTSKYLENNKWFKGSNLIGLTYEPLFPYFADTPNAFKILEGDFIEEGSGSGIVHMAPGFGEDDQRVCAQAGIPTVVPVDGEGRFTDAVYDFIETERCTLRAPSPADEPYFVALHTNPKVMETMNDGVMRVEDAKADFAANLAHFKEYGYGQWLAFNKETGAFMGRAGLSFIAQSKEMPAAPTLRCGLLPEFWHGGYGSELCRAALKFGFNEKQLPFIVAGAHGDNPRAHKMLERLGMVKEREVMFKRVPGPYYRMSREAFLEGSGLGEHDSGKASAAESRYPAPETLSLRGLNVIKETEGKHDDEPYSAAQLAKYGLANLRIINWLKRHGRLIKQEDYKHNYPHCWRTDEPIIYKAMSSWFVDVPKIRERMVELNQQINWIPAHIKDGRFGKWIENAREWSISRSRFWGCPIPVWRSDNPDNDELYVFGSIAELEAFFGPHMKEQAGNAHANADRNKNTSPNGRGRNSETILGEGFKITDLHRPYVDQWVAPDPYNSKYTIRRVEDVFDCWFESGSMPYAQVHYPFENKEWFETHFPADFIVEYEAQTRGWFYNMFVLAVALFDRIPFKNCICHGVVLDDQGRKLSKRLKNYMDPKALFAQYGADSLRWYMMSSTIMRGSELLLDPQGKFIHDAIRLYIKPIWNAYHFFTLYANADGVQAQWRTDSEHLMDRYILAKCREMVERVEAALDGYDTPSATQAITEFVESLNNWYIRRNKERFWKRAHDADKQAAYDTLYTVLHILCRTAAPLLPMVTEAIYRGLHGSSVEENSATTPPLRGSRRAESASDSAADDGDAVGGNMAAADETDGTPPPNPLPQGEGECSVHLADWPEVSEIAQEKALIADMDRVRDICNTALSIRNEAKIRVRQPLAALTVYSKAWHAGGPVTDAVIQDELNVHAVRWDGHIDTVADYKLKLNNPLIGKRLPAKMKQIIPASKKGEWEHKDNKLHICGEVLLPEEYELKLEPKPEIAGAAAVSSNDALVVLDLTLTPELEAEGTARDLVRMIQQARKDADLHVSDTIHLVLDLPESAAAALEQHRDYIAEQTLAASLIRGDAGQAEYKSTGELEGRPVTIGLSRQTVAA